MPCPPALGGVGRFVPVLSTAQPAVSAAIAAAADILCKVRIDQPNRSSRAALRLGEGWRRLNASRPLWRLLHAAPGWRLGAVEFGRHVAGRAAAGHPADVVLHRGIP